MGRPAIAPEILLALWLYATLDGVGSAREIVRLTEAHDAYRWFAERCGRAATAECVNAQSRNRGLQQFKVRGLVNKVKCVMLIFALAHNLMRLVSLAPELIGIGTGTSVLPGMMA